MRKGERTRNMILERSAALFNQHGYLSAPLSSVMEQTGLEKGGIYNHFGSKEELALQAFDYSVSQMGVHFLAAVNSHEHAVERLSALVDVFGRMVVDPPVPGGCPVMNAAIESDDQHPQLAERARQAMDGLRGLVERIVREGVERQELRADVDPAELSSVLIATLEGALMISRLYGDAVHMERAVRHVKQHLKNSSGIANT
ncbi:MAG: TetR family transcriptional regulator C-terminal domain-containing protein [Tumebacillaceae bacterium]